MLDFSPSIESPIQFKKETIELKYNQFKVCTVHQSKEGTIHKKLIYAHHDGEKINITILDLKTNEVTRK
mgnify:CR=1 FL=1